MINITINDPAKWLTKISDSCTDNEKGYITTYLYNLFPSDWSFYTINPWDDPDIPRPLAEALNKLADLAPTFDNPNVKDLALNRLLFEIINKYSFYEVNGETPAMWFQKLAYHFCGTDGIAFWEKIKLISLKPDFKTISDYGVKTFGKTYNVNTNIQNTSENQEEIMQPMTASTSLNSNYANQANKSAQEIQGDSGGIIENETSAMTNNINAFIWDLSNRILDPITDLVEEIEECFIFIRRY